MSKTTKRRTKRRTAKAVKPKREKMTEENTEPKKKGRPTVNPKTVGIFSRCSDEQKEAMQTYVDGLNPERIKKGLPPLKLSTWVREIALIQSGNKHLTDGAIRARMAEQSSEML